MRSGVGKEEIKLLNLLNKFLILCIINNAIIFVLMAKFKDPGSSDIIKYN